MKQPISISAHKAFQKNRSSQEDIQAVQSLSRVLDPLTRACVMETSERTGVSPLELLRHMVREWYEIQYDVSASFLGRAIERSKRDAERWGTAV